MHKRRRRKRRSRPLERTFSRTDADHLEQVEVSNKTKTAAGWKPDIIRSVKEYDTWYLKYSPTMFADARGAAVAVVDESMRATDDFRSFDAKSLRTHPGTVFVARMAVSPPMARDRFVGFAGANKSAVLTMERDGIVPAKMTTAALTAMCDFLRPLLDPGLFVWLADGRAATPEERDKAKLVIGERLATANYLPTLRNAQEARQKALMTKHLEAIGFKWSDDLAMSMRPGTYAMGRNVRVIREDGQPQNLPVDCVVAPMGSGRPLACIEMKSAGDFANVNKRRKEEADKHQALHRAHGDEAIFLLQLFGYFGPPYLSYEASAGIDWAWDHRLSDLDEYLVP